MRLVVRADAGVEMGGGHVMRSRALAEALIAHGWEARFAADAGRAVDVGRLAGGLDVIALDAPADGEAEALADSLPDGCDLLLVDHYGRGEPFERACRGWARRIAVIDDFPVRAHDCDLLIDATPSRQPDDYHGLVPKATRVLTGPMYAPLRAQFARARWAHVLVAGTANPPQILVALGATDARNVTAAVLRSLDAVEMDMSIIVVLSGAAPHLDEVRRMIGGLRHEVRLHVDETDMAGLMTAADTAIGGGGGSAWERCCLGLPSVALRLADNQSDALAGLKAAGAAETVEPGDAESLTAAVGKLLADAEKRAAMSRAASALCDGLGAPRIALALMNGMSAKDGQRVELRPVEDRDATILFDWQHDADTRRHARNPAPPSQAEHRAWFAAKRADPGCIFHMLEHDGDVAGTLRLDHDRVRDGFEVSIIVAPGKRGLGIGGTALRQIGALLPQQRLLAYVKRENEASLRMFAAAGYRPIGGDWYEKPAQIHD